MKEEGKIKLLMLASIIGVILFLIGVFNISIEIGMFGIIWLMCCSIVAWIGFAKSYSLGD